MYYLASNGEIYDDGFGAESNAYGIDAQGFRYELTPPVMLRLTDRYREEHAPTRSRIPIGDAIAKVTSAMGIQPCTPCKQRQRALNNFGDRVANVARYFR